MPNIEIGKKGEEIATKFLQKKGYRIIGRNVREGEGEIDIVVLKGGKLGFVEVRTTTSEYLSSPLCSINKKKKNSFKKTALKISTHLGILQDKIAFHFIGIKIKGDEISVVFYENIT